MTPIRSSVLAVVGAAAVACASPAEEGCLPVAPATMPDGTDLRPAVGQSLDGAARVLIWRSGEAFILQRIFVAGAAGELACPAGQLGGPTDCLPEGELNVRGRPAVFAPTSEPDDWFIAWADGECRYETVFGPLPEAEARAYAARY